MSINEYIPMLLLTVNNSIGDKKSHFTSEKLVNLFDKKDSEFTELDKYAIETIQTEATSQEIIAFKEVFNINSEKIDYLLKCHIY